MTSQDNLTKEDRKMLRSVFWRSWTMNASRTGATQYHAVGVIYTLLPVINRFYKTDKDKAEALVRHTTWFNATMHINNFIMGLVASMEKKNSEDPDFDASAITAVKASLMGPISGVGDSFFWEFKGYCGRYRDFLGKCRLSHGSCCLLTLVQYSCFYYSLL